MVEKLEAGKFTKLQVAFEHPAKGPHHCGECRHFLRSILQCRIVAGTIMPADWCKKFEAK